MSSTVGRAALGVGTLGASEALPSKFRNRLATPIGTGLTLGTSQLVDAYTKGVPKPPQPVAPATTDDKAVQQVVAEGAARRSRARGYRSTILSQNFLSPSPPKDLASTLGA